MAGAELGSRGMLAGSLTRSCLESMAATASVRRFEIRRCPLEASSPQRTHPGRVSPTRPRPPPGSSHSPFLTGIPRPCTPTPPAVRMVDRTRPEPSRDRRIILAVPDGVQCCPSAQNSPSSQNSDL
jgi:hypothetical protein